MNARFFYSLILGLFEIVKWLFIPVRNAKLVECEHLISQFF
jgi:hypothetical protein